MGTPDPRPAIERSLERVRIATTRVIAEGANIGELYDVLDAETVYYLIRELDELKAARGQIERLESHSRALFQLLDDLLAIFRRSASPNETDIMHIQTQIHSLAWQFDYVASRAGEPVAPPAVLQEQLEREASIAELAQEQFFETYRTLEVATNTIKLMTEPARMYYRTYDQRRWVCSYCHFDAGEKDQIQHSSGCAGNIALEFLKGHP